MTGTEALFPWSVLGPQGSHIRPLVSSSPTALFEPSSAQAAKTASDRKRKQTQPKKRDLTCVRLKLPVSVKLHSKGRRGVCMYSIYCTGVSNVAKCLVLMCVWGGGGTREKKIRKKEGKKGKKRGTQLG